MNLCVSYPATLRLMDELSKTHSVPLEKWIEEGVVFKFWGDNVDKKRRVRDLRSDHKGTMLHNMFSLLVGRSRTPGPQFPHVGQLSRLSEVPSDFFLPTSSDVSKVKTNLTHLVSRVLTKYIPGLACFAKIVPKHITHPYSTEMSHRSEVYTLDVLMKNEALHKDMIDIMTRTLQQYLGDGYNHERRVLSGGDQLTKERQIGAQRHMMCGNSIQERLELLEPTSEDWHCMVCFLKVRCKQCILYVRRQLANGHYTCRLLGRVFMASPHVTMALSGFSGVSSTA